jgi:hypothetical protein
VRLKASRAWMDFQHLGATREDDRGLLLAPHTSGPRDVPRCGALSLLQKDAALQGGSSRNRCRLNVKLRTSVTDCVVQSYCLFYTEIKKPRLGNLKADEERAHSRAFAVVGLCFCTSLLAAHLPPPAACSDVSYMLQPSFFF